MEDEVTLLGDRDELERFDVAQLVIGPSRQRLGADDGTISQPDLRLVGEAETLAKVEGDAEPFAQLQRAVGSSAHLGGVVAVGGAARGASRLESQHGALQQLIGGIGIHRGDGNAGTGDDHDSRLFVAYFVEGVENLGGNPAGVLGTVEPAEQDGELIASDPADQIRRSQGAAQGSSAFLDHPIAGAIPIAFARLFDSDHQQADQVVIAPAAIEHANEVVAQRGAAGETGEMVDIVGVARSTARRGCHLAAPTGWADHEDDPHRDDESEGDGADLEAVEQVGAGGGLRLEHSADFRHLSLKGIGAGEEVGQCVGAGGVVEQHAGRRRHLPVGGVQLGEPDYRVGTAGTRHAELSVAETQRVVGPVEDLEEGPHVGSLRCQPAIEQNCRGAQAVAAFDLTSHRSHDPGVLCFDGLRIPHEPDEGHGEQYEPNQRSGQQSVARDGVYAGHASTPSPS